MNQYAEGLNGLLNLLVEAQNSETIRQATEELKHNYFENKLCIEGLAVICQRSPRHEVRQLAAVELRKQINRWWEEIDNMTRITIRGQFLDSVVTEQHDLVRNSLARVISSIARVDLQELGWPELSNFLNQTCTHETPGIREIGLYILYTLFETAGEQFLNQIPSLFDMFKVSIVDTASLKVRVTTVMLLGKLAEFIDSGEQDYIKQFKSMVPAMVGVLEECLKNGDEEKAGEIFEVFDTLLMLDVPLLSDHLVDLIRFFLQVAANREIDDAIRVMALSFLMWAAVYKQSKIRSLKLVGYIIEGVMPVGTEPEPEDNDEEPPSRLAFKVINSLGNNMPPQQVYPIVLPIVTRYLQHQDPGYRKAAMMGLAVIVEGCADYMAPRMDEVLQFVCTGLRDPDVTVRRGACMALSSLADELPAEIKERHKQLIPLVVNLMGDAGAEITSSACNALDAILDGLGKDVVPYLPELCPGLLRLLLAGPTVEMHSSALSAIGSIAHAAGRDFQPYFEQVIPEVFKLMKCTGEPQYLTVRGVATDTAAFIAEAVGPDYFRNYLDPAMQLTIAQLAPEFPRLKESSYGFFAVMARVFGEEFARFLPLVIPVLIQTCEEKERNDDILEGQLDLAGDIEDEDVFENFYFDSVVASEKNFAVQALGDLFENTKTHFLPYVDDTLRQLENLHSHIDEDVRSSVTRSLFTYLRAFHIISHQGEWVPGLPVKYPVHDNVQKMVDFVMVSVMKAWPEEDNKMVVIMILQEMAKALKLVGPALVAQYVEDIARNLLEIYEKRSMCQQSFDDEDYVDEDEEGSAESVLIGAACDLVSALCETLGDNFSSYFDVFMPLISSYYKKSRSPADRSMAVGCLAECINGVKSAVTPHTEKLLQLFIKGTSDDDQTVRSNAAYGLGLLVTFSQIDLSSQYPAILTALHPLFQNQPLPNTTDNAAGAVARLILAHPNAVPLDQVLPVFFTALPLKADYAENEPVFACLFQLFQSNNAFVMNSVPQFLRVFAHVLSDEAQLSNVTRGQLIELIRALNAQSNNHAIASSELARFL